MEKKQSAAQSLKTKRSSLIYKTIQKNQEVQNDQLPSLAIQQGKTVKIANKFINNFPVLNFFSSKANEKIKCCSLQHKELKNSCRKRQKTIQIQRSSSFIFKQTNRQKLSQNLKSQMNLDLQCNMQHLKLPLIRKNLSIHGSNEQNLNNIQQKSVEDKRKKSRKNMQCKILLANKNLFPFTDRNTGYEFWGSSKNQGRIGNLSEKKKQLFNLNISRIGQKGQINQNEFISQDSLTQIPIF